MPDAPDNKAKLIGKRLGRGAGEAVGLEFLDDGRLAYAVLSEHGAQIMRMTYRVEGAFLVTDQPSHPCDERTRFWWDYSGALVLEFGGDQSRFMR